MANVAFTARPTSGARILRARHVASCPAHITRRTAVAAPIIGLAAASLPCAPVSAMDIAVETDKQGRERVKYEKGGWNFWQWQGHRVHYITAGTKGPPVLLIHGYGASAYHWRYQIPALAKSYRVFALDLLGFGWSEKALVEYSSGGLWGQQITDFIQQVIYAPADGGPDASSDTSKDTGARSSNGGSSTNGRQQGTDEQRVVLVGNSLGGYACMNAAVKSPELIGGVALLNSAGPLQDSEVPELQDALPVPWYAGIRGSLTDMTKRVVLWFAFQRAKQPERIKEVLEMVYSSNDTIDEDLVDSIVVPASDPAAAEVFYRINSSKGPTVSVNQLLKQMRGSKLPLLLLWGDLDPWITPRRADRIQQLYPEAERVRLQSGHCPHDDTPQEANDALLAWLGRVCRD